MWLTVLALALAGVLGMDDILARVAALEAADVGSRARLSQLEDEAVRSRASQQAAGMAELTARLDPGSLTQIVPYPGGSERLPALAQPLLARLQSDGSLPGLAAGRTDPVEGSVNLLWDPLFETFQYPGALTTAYVAHGPDWEAKYVLNSGTVATTRTLVEQGRKGDATAYVYGFEHSVVVGASLVFGVGAADMTIYLRSSHDGPMPPPETSPSWLTAAVRAVAAITTGLDTATAYMEIVDSSDTLLAQSDPVDLVSITDVAETFSAEVGLEAPDGATEHRWRLRIDATKSAGAVAELSLFLANPLLAYSDDGTPPMFTPAVGLWIPATVRARAVRVYRTTTQAIATSTDTSVLFDSGNASESYDTDGMHSLSSTTAHLIAPVTGIYHVDGGVGFAGNATGRRDLWIEANGDGVKRALQRELNPTATDAYLVTGCDINLSAGAYVRLMVWQNSGGNLNVLGNDRTTFFNMHLVGAADV